MVSVRVQPRGAQGERVRVEEEEEWGEDGEGGESGHVGWELRGRNGVVEGLGEFEADEGVVSIDVGLTRGVKDLSWVSEWFPRARRVVAFGCGLEGLKLERAVGVREVYVQGNARLDVAGGLPRGVRVLNVQGVRRVRLGVAGGVGAGVIQRLEVLNVRG